MYGGTIDGRATLYIEVEASWAAGPRKPLRTTAARKQQGVNHVQGKLCNNNVRSDHTYDHGYTLTLNDAA